MDGNEAPDAVDASLEGLADEHPAVDVGLLSTAVRYVSGVSGVVSTQPAKGAAIIKARNPGKGTLAHGATLTHFVDIEPENCGLQGDCEKASESGAGGLEGRR